MIPRASRVDGVKFGNAVAVCLLVLTGCTAPAVTTAGPVASPPAGAPSSSVATVPPTPTSGHAGPLLLPASDGGPMLWPIATTTDVGRNYYPGEGIRYGFVDSTGTLVVPARYEGYEYCRDAAGRVASLVVTRAGRNAEVLDLAGTRIRKVPTASAECGPVGTVLFTRQFGGSESGVWRDGIVEVATGKILVGLAPKRHIAVLDTDTIDVSEPAGDYFLNIRTGRRTPHEGTVGDAEWQAGAPGVPATATDGDPLMGFLGRDGSWVLAPRFDDATGFRAGHAIVSLDGERYTFIDTHFRQVGGAWTEIDPVAVDRGSDWEVVGYVVTGEAGTALLGADLRTVVPPGDARIGCDTDPGTGACSVSAPDGTESRALLPEGTLTVMPVGYSSLGRSFATDSVDTADGGTANSRILALPTGAIVVFDWLSSCRAVGTEWAVCEPNDSPVPPTVILDAEGRRTPFATIEQLADAVKGARGAYYRVTTGRHTGIVDEHGTWLYRQGRFTELED
ncbi:MAG TPA: WG repeat-containing protein [Propionicimonas sp.]